MKHNNSEQLELLNFHLEDGWTQSLEFFDALPKYNYHRVAKTKTPILHRKTLSHRQKDYKITLYPAVIEDKEGQSWNAHAGKREEMVMNVLRYLAVQSRASTGSSIPKDEEAKIVYLDTTIHEVRKMLTDLGHGYKWAEISEALEILQGASTKIERKGTEWRHTILYDIMKTTNGKLRVHFSMLASQAILKGAHRPLSFSTLMTLKKPLSRWIYKQMIHFLINGEAHKPDMFQDEGLKKGIGYRFSYDDVFNMSGLQEMSRKRDSIAKIKEALDEMTEKGVLCAITPTSSNNSLPYEELNKGNNWLAYPSNRTVSEIIYANKHKKNPEQHLNL